ncbi:MAG: peptidoglycan/xylan/chitin deacetylase (PgdA/CDA1 family) [Granulosicoccus sp.]|jgi:peptidoglycan/xylan/chitin deacetylase (PgdA/CDA1 family)
MTFKKLTRIFIVLLVISIMMSILGFIPWWSILLLVLVYLIWIIYGSITIHSNFFMDVVCSVDKPKQIALTFDDGPDPEHTPRMMDLLESRGLRGTFFLLGRNVTKHEKLTKEIRERGHIVANHTDTHPILWGLMSVKDLENEVVTTGVKIKKATGLTPNFFRPPFGVMNPKVVRMVKKLNLDVVGWDLRSRDGGPLNRDQIYKIVRPQLETSSILLFHDTNPETYFALERVLDDCKNLGLEIVPLDQLIGKPAYA